MTREQALDRLCTLRAGHPIRENADAFIAGLEVLGLVKFDPEPPTAHQVLNELLASGPLAAGHVLVELDKAGFEVVRKRDQDWNVLGTPG